MTKDKQSNWFSVQNYPYYPYYRYYRFRYCHCFNEETKTVIWVIWVISLTFPKFWICIQKWYFSKGVFSSRGNIPMSAWNLFLPPRETEASLREYKTRSNCFPFYNYPYYRYYPYYRFRYCYWLDEKTKTVIWVIWVILLTFPKFEYFFKNYVFF